MPPNLTCLSIQSSEEPIFSFCISIPNGTCGDVANGESVRHSIPLGAPNILKANSFRVRLLIFTSVYTNKTRILCFSRAVNFALLRFLTGGSLDILRFLSILRLTNPLFIPIGYRWGQEYEPLFPSSPVEVIEGGGGWMIFSEAVCLSST